MVFSRQDAELYIPDGSEPAEALKRTTRLTVAAHQDDVEIMAAQGILACLGRQNEWFSAAVVTDGAGSPREGRYASYTDSMMRETRREEQKKAAQMGQYSACALLNHPSAVAKDGNTREVVEDIKALVRLTRPKVLYTHNPADRHDTHVAVALRVITALRELGPEYHPEKLYGCEVWRSLDWLNDEDKAVFDLSGHQELLAALLNVHDSQIAGGKRYDLATAGRRAANATYLASHSADSMEAAAFALDMTPLLGGGDVSAFVLAAISRFAEDVKTRISNMAGASTKAE